MRFTVDRSLLLKALSRVQGVIEKRSNMPILSMVLLEASDANLRISATDLEIAYRQVLNASITQDGSVATHGRKLFEILRESNAEDIEITSLENSWIRISDGSARFNLAGLPAEEYPTQIEPADLELVEVDASTISEMISKTIYAVTLEEAGFKLSGIYTEKVNETGGEVLRMVGTDGHRLSLVDKAIDGIERLGLAAGVMIPKKGMNEINRLASEGGLIQIGFRQNNCVVKKDGAAIGIRLLDTKFPDYRSVIRKEAAHKFTVDRTVLLKA
ncbi:MAG: DNA polymerase III subunit beta, partial [Deltaproteobacteria bacterium]